MPRLTATPILHRIRDTNLHSVCYLIQYVCRNTGGVVKYPRKGVFHYVKVSAKRFKMNTSEKNSCWGAIKKTGFVLENKITDILEANDWNVINNRYYIDDVTGSQREIDILAYKPHLVEDICIYTSLLVSCKKSEKNAWVFLTKPINIDNPNFDYFKISNITNLKIFTHYKYDNQIKKAVRKNLHTLQFLDEIYNLDRNVYGFQEIDLNKGTPQNDKRIYESIASTIKALAYELQAIRQRRKQAVLYNFNLLTVFEGRMIEAFYRKKNKPEIDDVKVLKYLNRFIINKKDDYYRIHFIKYDHLQDYLDNFNQLHEWQKQFYSNIFSKYQSSFLSDYALRNLYRDEIKNEILSFIDFQIKWDYKYNIETLENLYFSADEDNNVLQISIGIENEEIVKKLNSDEFIINLTKDALARWARYHGELEFVISPSEDDIPF